MQWVMKLSIKTNNIIWFWLTVLELHGVASNAKNMHILFVGNSLTYSNSIPDLIVEFGKLDGNTITYHNLLKPNYSLEDYWLEGQVQKEIRTGKYDIAILQQGPSALLESQELLLKFTEKIAKICSEYNVQVALYMVWPSRFRYFDFDNVILSYKNVAISTKSLICPVGLVWKKGFDSKSFALNDFYSIDGFHPTMAGSTVAALTIYASISNKSDLNFFNEFPPNWNSGFTATKLHVLKQLLLESIAETNGYKKIIKIN